MIEMNSELKSDHGIEGKNPEPPLASLAESGSEMIWAMLAQIPDPEIPVISIVELGIVRNVKLNKGKVIVSITPTYSGCPAMKVIEQEVMTKLHENGMDAEIKTVYSPVWTTDWIGDQAKEKLRKYGIAPPEKRVDDKTSLFGGSKEIHCPRCQSVKTELISQFGSTACKALYRCKECLEPFDYFKCH